MYFKTKDIKTQRTSKRVCLYIWKMYFLCLLICNMSQRQYKIKNVGNFWFDMAVKLNYQMSNLH